MGDVPRQRIEQAFHSPAPPAVIHVLKTDIFTIGGRDLRILSS
jgi:hypothetical protein